MGSCQGEHQMDTHQEHNQAVDKQGLVGQGIQVLVDMPCLHHVFHAFHVYHAFHCTQGAVLETQARNLAVNQYGLISQ